MSNRLTTRLSAVAEVPNHRRRIVAREAGEGHQLAIGDLDGQVADNRFGGIDAGQHRDDRRCGCGPYFARSGQGHRVGAGFAVTMGNQLAQFTASIAEIPLKTCRRTGTAIRERNRLANLHRVSIEAEVGGGCDLHRLGHDGHLNRLRRFVSVAVADDQRHGVVAALIPGLLHHGDITRAGSIAKVPCPRGRCTRAEIGESNRLTNIRRDRRRRKVRDDLLGLNLFFDECLGFGNRLRRRKNFGRYADS